MINSLHRWNTPICDFLSLDARAWYPVTVVIWEAMQRLFDPESTTDHERKVSQERAMATLKSALGLSDDDCITRDNYATLIRKGIIDTYPMCLPVPPAVATRITDMAGLADGSSSPAELQSRLMSCARTNPDTHKVSKTRILPTPVNPPRPYPLGVARRASTRSTSTNPPPLRTTSTRLPPLRTTSTQSTSTHTPPFHLPPFRPPSIDPAL